MSCNIVKSVSALFISRVLLSAAVGFAVDVNANRRALFLSLSRALFEKCIWTERNVKTRPLCVTTGMLLRIYYLGKFPIVSRLNDPMASRALKLSHQIADDFHCFSLEPKHSFWRKRKSRKSAVFLLPVFAIASRTFHNKPEQSEMMGIGVFFSVAV